MKKRYIELDSLRGVAALTVVFSHLVLATALLENNSSFIQLIDKTPLHIIYAGHEAVMFFFILSGFVLTLPFLNGRTFVFSEFIIKRFTRIYIPMFSMLLISLILMKITIRFRDSNVSEWLSNLWQSDITLVNIINHITLIGLYDYNTINPVIWSLVHEMRISFLIPIIIYIVVKYRWEKVVACALIFSICGGALHFLWGSGHISIGKTVHYTSMFIIGSLLAKNKDILIKYISDRSKVFIASLFVVSILLYTYPFWFFSQIGFIHNTLVNDWVTTIGASIILILALSSAKFSSILSWRPIHFLGEISYSLYLFHLVIILVLFNIFGDKVNIILLSLVSIVINIIISSINYFYVEKYSIYLGRKLVDMRKHKLVNQVK